MRTALVAISTVLWSAICTAEQLEYVGNYRDIRASDTSHCYGFDLMLWKESEQRVVGLFTRYAGPCADASCSVVTGTIHEPAMIRRDVAGAITGRELRVANASRTIAGHLHNTAPDVTGLRFAPPSTSPLRYGVVTNARDAY